MLVTNNESINRYVADGIVKLFPIAFQFLNNDHVAVYRYESGTLVKVDKSEYTISGAGSELGGQCEFTLAPASGIVLAFIRDVPITQLTQYSELDNFPAESHENALSKLTMICQMLAESLTRAVTVSPTSTETPGELVERIFDARDRAETAATATAVSEEAAASSAMASAASAANSDASANLAEQWASSPYGSVVENGEYSAKHYSIEAKNAVPDNLVGRVEAVEGKTQPATTSSLGIMREAVAVDFNGPVVNGPAALTIGSTALSSFMPVGLIGAILPFYVADGYVPNGCVLPDGAEYTQSQFPTFYTDYLAAGRVVTCTYAEFAAQVAATGNCAKFALDTDNQKFKVPLLKDGDSITQAASAAELGKSVKAGLPEIWADGLIGFDSAGYYGGALRSPAGTHSFAVAAGGIIRYESPTSDHVFQASRCNGIYGNSTTVTDEQVRLRHFVVVASAQNNQSMFDWSAYMSALAGKANADLSNITANGNAAIRAQAREADKVVLLSTCTTTGSWTITDCEIGRPLFIIVSKSAAAAGYAQLYVISGSNDGLSVGAYGYVIGYTSQYISTNVFMCVPTSETVVVQVHTISANCTLFAKQ